MKLSLQFVVLQVMIDSLFSSPALDPYAQASGVMQRAIADSSRPQIRQLPVESPRHHRIIWKAHRVENNILTYVLL